MERSLINMAYLPPELLHLTFTYSDISVRDLKSVRQVCKSWNDTATSLVFRRVCLSKLKSDWDAFLNIAAQPHLAACVRVLVWHELAEDESAFSSLSEYKFPPAEVNLFLELASQARDLFWFVTNDNSSGNGDYFRAQLHHALDAMPGLHTIASQPMHPYYQLTKPGPGYPLTAQLLQRDLNSSDEERNYGFLTYLAPVIAARSTAGKSTIPRLCFGDEGMTTSLGRFSPDMHPLFQHLTDLDLCISPAMKGMSLDGLQVCLKAARNLTSFGLCFERSCSPPSGKLDHKGVTSLLYDPEMHWPQLRSLRIEDSGFSSKGLGYFLRRHAESIRSVTIYADFTVKQCKYLRSPVGSEGAVSLRLEQLTIIPQSTDGLDVPEEELLEYMNKGIPSSTLESIGEHIVRTRSFTYDMDEWATVPTHNHAEPQVAQEGMLYNEASEGHQTQTTGEEYGGENSDDSIMVDNSLMVDAAAEQASHSKRLLQAPRWVWEWCSELKDYCYRKAHPGEESTETEMWYFQHRNGEAAYGNEPLEFWEDWEGSEAGDVAEAVPFDRKLIHTMDDASGLDPVWVEQSDGTMKIYFAHEDPTSN
ncbi:hypothetical protein F4820DRAFT_408645 [Hypoxylon rubiginosum]|uniref:Uncharacterized protein n=1 Tax=Hypoxylon rubiginosum TaxID=110542 RepID=A0ACB9ZC46_9PEZI|nr:hypothetical protein F4820DRAFT_408645 [Hypoxylon rubiginosum]